MAYEIGSVNYKKQLTAMIHKHEQEFILAKISCPTLIITGKEDNVMPNERAEHMANHINDSKLVYIPDCGHMAMLEQSKIINELLSEWFEEYR